MSTTESAEAISQRRIQEGMLMMIAGMLLVPAIDAIAKGLSGSISPGQVVWSRFLFQSVFMLPFVLRAGQWRERSLLWAHAARGGLIALASLLFFAAIARMPLADALAIFFVEPFVLALLAALFLGERVGWRRLLAIGTGMIGALIIIRPSYDAFGATALLPLGAALSFALYVVLTRALAQTGSAVTMQFYAGIFGGLIMTVALVAGEQAGVAYLTPVWPTAGEWLLLALLGAIATVGHLLIVHAVRRVGAALIAPFQYLEIITATILGFVFFGDFPDATTWLGVVIIIGSGLYVFFRERRLAGARLVDPRP